MLPPSAARDGVSALVVAVAVKARVEDPVAFLHVRLPIAWGMRACLPRQASTHAAPLPPFWSSLSSFIMITKTILAILAIIIIM